MKQQEQKDQEFDFIKEKIKEKPINKRRLFFQMGFNLFCAVIFGVVACLVFVLLRPYMEAWINPKEESAISIPRDDLESEGEGGEETGGGEPAGAEAYQKPEEGEKTKDKTEGSQPEDTENPEGSPEGSDPAGESQELEDDPGGTEAGQQDQDPVLPPEKTEVVQKELGIEDYQKLQDKLYDVGKQANKSVVTVTGVTSSTDWFDTPYENENRAAGIVIGQTPKELLVLTEKKVITDAEAISITFANESTVSAALKKYDGNTGIAIISVPLDEIGEEALKMVETATLGNSLRMQQGTIVLAIGSPLGANYSILCGTITSSENQVSAIDTNYTIFTTDIVGSEDGSGVLINLEGEIVGLVLQDYSSQSDRNTITALSISELKQVIEDLSNGRDIPYLGLRLSTVTDDIAEEYGIPMGVYIKAVELDSPAMMAGLQEADVITQINGEEVTTVEQYNQKLYAMRHEDLAAVTVMRQGAEEYVEMECAVSVGVLK